MHLGLRVECENGRISSCVLIYPTKGRLKWINKTAALAVGITFLIHEELTRRTVTISRGAIQQKTAFKTMSEHPDPERSPESVSYGKLWRSELACW